MTDARKAALERFDQVVRNTAQSADAAKLPATADLLHIEWKRLRASLLELVGEPVAMIDRVIREHDDEINRLKGSDPIASQWHHGWIAALRWTKGIFYRLPSTDASEEVTT